MRRTRTILAVTTIAATLALTGCSSDSSSGSPTTADATTSASATTTSPSSAPTTTAAGNATGNATGKVVPVNQTIDDPDMGDHVVVESMVRGFPVPASLPAIADRELVLVKVNVTAGSKYYAGWQASGTQLLDAKGGTNSEGGATAIEDAMTAAGYPPLKDVKTGATGSGWLVYVVKEKGTPSLTFRIKRSAATTSGGGTIAAKNFDVPLPA